MNFDEIRKELAEESEGLIFAEAEVVDAEEELLEAEQGVKASKKQIRALRQILRNSGQPYEKKLKGVG